MDKNKVRQIHFSIDDIGKSLIWLKENRPISLFDMWLYGRLKEWHEKYDIKVTLYCYSVIRDFSFDQIPDRYRDDFEKNPWMRFGYHGRYDVPTYDNADYTKEHQMFLSTSKKLCMATTDTLRLHYWKVSNLQREYFKGQGIRTLLYPDKKIYPYGEDDSFREAGMNYWKTNVRFEHICNIDEKSLCMDKSRIVAFTHEGEFEAQADRIEEAIQMYREAGFVFI